MKAMSKKTVSMIAVAGAVLCVFLLVWAIIFFAGYCVCLPGIVMILLAAAVGAAAFFLLRPAVKQPQKNVKRFLAKDENGEEYILTQSKEGDFEDENGDKWVLSEDGEIFRRA